MRFVNQLIDRFDRFNDFFQRDETVRAIIIFAVVYMALQLIRALLHGWI